jgi:small subunit ribosomal protein S2
MLTNFPTIRKAVKKMGQIDKMMTDGTLENVSKREKLEKNLGSIADMTRLPSAVFVVDVMEEHIAVAEANRLGIPVFGIVDTNSNPNNIDFVIPANDDATKSIDVILGAVCDAIKEGLEERKVEKADEQAAEAQADAEAPAPKERRQRIRKAAPKAEAEKVAEVKEAKAEEAAAE